MSYVDIAIIAVAALFALIGLWKGVGVTLIKLICFAGAAVVAFILVDYVTGWLLGWDLTRGLLIGEGFSLRNLYYEAIGGEGFAATSGVMAYYVQPMIDRYTALGIGVYYGSVSMGEFVSLCMVYNSLTIICWLIIYWIVRAIFSLIGWILTKIFVREEKKPLSRILGFAFGAVRGVTFIMIILLVSSVIFPFEWAAGYTDTVSNSILGKPIAQLTYIGTDMAVYADPATEELMALAGYNKLSFDEKKEASKAALDEYKTYLVGKAGNNGYSESNIIIMDGLISEGKNAIDAVTMAGTEATADDFMAVVEVENAVKAAMAEIYTVDQEAMVATEKVSAKETLVTYCAGLKIGREQAVIDQLDAKLTEGKNAIDAVNKLGEADGIANSFKDALTAIVSGATE